VVPRISATLQLFHKRSRRRLGRESADIIAGNDCVKAIGLFLDDGERLAALVEHPAPPAAVRKAAALGHGAPFG
jgi:hypothetical protein